ncbi:uncharacterized protein F4807DRAFT_445900 [Annulohypoxylon truncatum]|uniref:uncharacterized protein n=1 Tax=Annulohypoxylon truncatum TaxID=327061 RepID=UPI0020073840|nr:uncharacterized protein F4807DRAFT_445900 [Annulohypoxylon truncatum]KAI1204699.1 hypothetical protein F4807DRAFT_445900 [Annulohypoxylon truncatum]
MGHPFQVTKKAFLGSGSALIILAALFVAARLVGGHRKFGKFSISDYISVSAILFLTGTFIIFNLTTDALNDPHTSLYYLLQLGTASTLIAAAATWTAKSPILFVYIQLFGIKQWLRVISYGVLIVTFLFLLSWNSYVAAICNPTGRDNLTEMVLKCTSVTATGGVIVGVIGVVTDIIILVLPLPIILRLNLPLRKRVGIIGVFLTGTFALAASAVSVYFRWASLSGLPVDYRAATTWNIIELSIAIMVGCVPAAYAFWMAYAINSVIFSRISAVVSLLSVNRWSNSKTSRTQSQPGGYYIPDERSENDIIHPCGVLDDRRSKDKGPTITTLDDTSQISLHRLSTGK